jgi:hypothetical protein
VNVAGSRNRNVSNALTAPRERSDARKGTTRGESDKGILPVEVIRVPRDDHWDDHWDDQPDDQRDDQRDDHAAPQEMESGYTPGATRGGDADELLWR